MQRNPCCLFLIAITSLAQAPAPLAQVVMRGDRFKPIAASDFTPEQKAFIDQVVKGPNPTTAGPYNMLLRSPDLGRVAHEFGAYLEQLEREYAKYEGFIAKGVARGLSFRASRRGGTSAGHALT